VQAEGAVRDKKFNDAANLYGEALKVAPWWPEGHFNRALVLSETGDYDTAMREMKHYLQLAPDAPNARAAQDKIYDWERRASK
jgi:predicted TPR repeat methyltransferase